MALLFMDGFDRDSTGKWSGTSGTVEFSSNTRFNKGKSVGAASYTQAYLAKRFITPINTVIFGGAYYIAIAQNNSYPYLAFFTPDGTQQIYLYSPNTHQIALVRGSTQIGLIADVAFYSWIYIEVQCTLSSTVGNVVVRINGIEKINFTGNTLASGTTTTIGAVNLASYGSSASTLIDDVYICDSSGSTNNTFLGDVRVHTLVPASAGSSTQFAPTGGANYANVGELSDNVSTYNSSAVVGERDLYGLSDIPVSTGQVYGVQNRMTAWKSDAGMGMIRQVLKVGGNMYYDPTLSLGTSATGYTSDVRETNPATSAAWTVSDVNGVELGVEVA